MTTMLTEETVKTVIVVLVFVALIIVAVIFWDKILDVVSAIGKLMGRGGGGIT